MTKQKGVGYYVIGKTIGEGTFGRVKLGQHLLTGEVVAIKVLEKAKIVEVADVERVARELHILKLLRHPHVIQLYEIIETPEKLYLIMEYCSKGELFDLIVDMGRLPEVEASRLFRQILYGVEHLHRVGVAHRDLKPENLLLDDGRDIKIADFGLSNTFRNHQRLKTACGSPCYAPPEMISGFEYEPMACDVWSCGVILFALVCGYLPFEDENQSVLYNQILAARYELPDYTSPVFNDLVSRILVVDPTQRITLPQILEHRWFKPLPLISPRVIVDHAGDIKLDEELLGQFRQWNVSRDYAEKCLRLRKHNYVTTIYFLLLSKKRRQARAQKQGRGAAPAVPQLTDAAVGHAADRSAGEGRLSLTTEPELPATDCLIGQELGLEPPSAASTADSEACWRAFDATPPPTPLMLAAAGVANCLAPPAPHASEPLPAQDRVVATPPTPRRQNSPDASAGCPLSSSSANRPQLGEFSDPGLVPLAAPRGAAAGRRPQTPELPARSRGGQRPERKVATNKSSPRRERPDSEQLGPATIYVPRSARQASPRQGAGEVRQGSPRQRVAELVVSPRPEGREGRCGSPLPAGPASPQLRSTEVGRSAMASPRPNRAGAITPDRPRGGQVAVRTGSGSRRGTPLPSPVPSGSPPSGPTGSSSSPRYRGEGAVASAPASLSAGAGRSASAQPASNRRAASPSSSAPAPPRSPLVAHRRVDTVPLLGTAARCRPTAPPSAASPPLTARSTARRLGGAGPASAAGAAILAGVRASTRQKEEQPQFVSAVPVSAQGPRITSSTPPRQRDAALGLAARRGVSPPGSVPQAQGVRTPSSECRRVPASARVSSQQSRKVPCSPVPTSARVAPLPTVGPIGGHGGGRPALPVAQACGRPGAKPAEVAAPLAVPPPVPAPTQAATVATPLAVPPPAPAPTQAATLLAPTSRGLLRSEVHHTRSSPRQPAAIMQDLLGTLGRMEVGFKQTSPTSVKCERKGVRFEIKLESDSSRATVHRPMQMVSISRITGEHNAYADMCMKVFSESRL